MELVRIDDNMITQTAKVSEVATAFFIIHECNRVQHEIIALRLDIIASEFLLLDCCQ
jgi:hypothetical protein